MADFDDELLADVGQPAPDIGDNSLRSVAALAASLRDLDAEIAHLEDRLKDTKERRRKLSQETLPDAMAEVGLSSFRLHDGAAVEVEPIIRASISKDRAPAAHEWLRRHGHGDLIKHVVVASYGRGDEDKAQALLRFAEVQRAKAEAKEAVHPQTLNGWAREMMKSGREIPADLFGLFTGREAVISTKRK
jgi:hypothetical protein